MSEKEELRVKKIKDGTVIDHINAGHALDVLNILGITGHEGYVLSIVMNVSSYLLGRKDIVKIEGRELNPEEVDKIALISPRATINIIRDFLVVGKQRVKLPKVMKGILRCANPTCITNSSEPLESIFNIEDEDPQKLRCYFCNRTMNHSDILKQISAELFSRLNQ